MYETNVLIAVSAFGFWLIGVVTGLYISSGKKW